MPFIVALTHRSFSPHNYERLEFVGDIIVKFALISAQFVCFPNADEAGMSIASAELKSNALLGRCTFEMGLHRMLLISEMLEEGIAGVTQENIDDRTFPLNKIFGDLFESMTAAIGCTYGLTAACNFVTEHVIRGKWPNDADRPTLQPKAQMLEFVQGRLKILPKVNVWMHGLDYFSYVDIDKVRAPIFGESTDDNMAEQIVGRKITENEDQIVETIESMVRESNEEEVVQPPFFVTYE